MDENEAAKEIQICPHCKTIYRDDGNQTTIYTGREVVAETELEAKVREFHELVSAGYEPKQKALAVEWSMKNNNYIREQMQKFYAGYGRWPEFKPNPEGGVVMEMIETKEAGNQ
jgi:hypothetical protein